eukprot:7325178-Prymnesium_polylepis.2
MQQRAQARVASGVPSRRTPPQPRESGIIAAYETIAPTMKTHSPAQQPATRYLSCSSCGRARRERGEQGQHTAPVRRQEG